MPHSLAGWRALAAWTASFVVVSGVARAQSIAGPVSVSPDVTITLGAGTPVDAADEDVVVDDLAGTTALADLGSLPEASDVSGYELLDDGEELLCFDTTVELPGAVFATPGDVVRYDGATYSIVFDASTNGVPEGARCDGVTSAGDLALLMTFDVTVELPDGAGGTFTADDEDVVIVDGPSAFTLLDLSLSGVPAELDVDGLLFLPNGNLAVSFDTGGEVGGVSFDDEDVLELDAVASSWSLALDLSGQDPDWGAADADAIALPEPGQGWMLALGCTVLLGARRRRLRRWSPGRRTPEVPR